MSLKVTVNKTSAFLMGLFSAAFLLAAVSLMTVDSYIGGAACIILALFYAGICAAYAASVRIDAQGISQRILFFPRKFYSWDSLREVGIFGSNVLRPEKKGKIGTLYIYVSTEEMDDDARFKTFLKWPIPLIHFVYTPRALEIVQYYWDGKIETYHTGDHFT